jgi:hypothetical protein
VNRSFYSDGLDGVGFSLWVGLGGGSVVWSVGWVAELDGVAWAWQSLVGGISACEVAAWSGRRT